MHDGGLMPVVSDPCSGLDPHGPTVVDHDTFMGDSFPLAAVTSHGRDSSSVCDIRRWEPTASGAAADPCLSAGLDPAAEPDRRAPCAPWFDRRPVVAHAAALSLARLSPDRSGFALVTNASRGCCTEARETRSRPNTAAVSQTVRTRILRSQEGTART